MKVLVVEDNTLNQEVMSLLLKKIGVCVTVAGNGQEGLHQFTEGTYDLIFMDINMPVMDGIKATQAIRALEKGQTIPIIGVTANSLDSDQQQYLRAGMTDVLLKPIDKKILESLLLPYRFPSTVSVLLKRDSPPRDGLLDQSYLKTLMEDITTERVLALIGEYKNEAFPLLETLSSSSTQDKHHNAHTLAGLSDNMGAVTLGKLARQLMRAYQNQSPEIDSLIHELKETFTLTLKEFEKFSRDSLM